MIATTISGFPMEGARLNKNGKLRGGFDMFEAEGSQSVL